MTPPCQIIQNGGCPSRTADQIWKSPTGCAILKSQISTSPHQKVRRIPVCKTEPAYFYSRAFRFATHYIVSQMSMSGSDKRSSGCPICTLRLAILSARRSRLDKICTMPVI